MARKMTQLWQKSFLSFSEFMLRNVEASSLAEAGDVDASMICERAAQFADKAEERAAERFDLDEAAVGASVDDALSDSTTVCLTSAICEAYGCGPDDDMCRWLIRYLRDSAVAQVASINRLPPHPAFLPRVAPALSPATIPPPPPSPAPAADVPREDDPKPKWLNTYEATEKIGVGRDVLLGMIRSAPEDRATGQRELSVGKKFGKDVALKNKGCWQVMLGCD